MTQNKNHLNEVELANYVELLRKDEVEKSSQKILQHIEDCNVCKNEVIELFSFLEKDQSIPPQRKLTLPLFFQQKSIWKYAISAAAVAIIIPMLFVINNSILNPQFNIDTFSKNPGLDHFVNENFRSESLMILSPLNDKEFAREENIIFNWKGKANLNLTLNILSNEEELIYSFSMIENHYNLQDELQRGLYYWQLETEDDLLFTGKFYIR
ncbi:MAG: hypothetical protein H8E72_04825 [Candidatus Marinimicrobia bacterium]|nr:hypothetical protein [Candidatus Neomarinimicrobiota bacterium]